MVEWNRLSGGLTRGLTRLASVIVLAPGACSFTDFDPLTAGLTAGTGGQAGSAGSGGGGVGGGGAGNAGTESSTAGTDSGPTNLLDNPGFEDGPALWAPLGNCTTTLDTTNPRSGESCLLVSNRTQAWEGPSYPLLGILEPGLSYSLVVWARAQSGTYPITLTYKKRCTDDPSDGVYTQLGSRAVSSEWTELTGLVLAPDCTLLESVVYLDAAPVGENYWIDDTRLELIP
jgi:endo-1,4-beta-xylanase